MGITFSIRHSNSKHPLNKMKAFIAAVACLAILPAISSANTFVQEREDTYPPTGNPLALFSYCTSMSQGDDTNPFALPQCIIVSLVYGQCCTALPCYADTGNAGMCEMMHGMVNQMLPGLIAGVTNPSEVT